MPEEPAINSTPPAPDPVVIPVETPVVVPAPEPVAPASAEASTVAEAMVDKTAGKSVEPASAEATAGKPAPAPVPEVVVPVAPTPPADSAGKPPATDSSIRQLLIKAKEKIQFRKQAKLEKIMAKARELGSIGNDETQKLLRVSDATASRYLSQLVKTGRLRLSGKSKATRYIPAQ